ncbi:hypothetical protein HD806DRAFT_522347 [Xylariaceae sp. AK1471]|nr:hypothetical protein HD806DRAFT_522347 [Xylariaceae sp. AK1471]
MNALKDMKTRWNTSWGTYQEVDSSEELLEKADQELDHDFESHAAAVIRSYRKLVALQWSAILFLLVCAFALLLALVLKRPTDKQCGIQTTIWSPANEAIEYEMTELENGFAHESVYRGPPTPEREKAWERLWRTGDYRFPEEQLSLINRTVDLGNNRTLKPWHDGKGGYHGQLEVFHQLHCLNLIRQYTWRDWYFRHPDIVRISGDMAASDVEARMHTDHCIEAVRLALMCHGDTTPAITVMNPKAPRGEMSDFSPAKKCRKFEKLQEWSVRNALNYPPLIDWNPGKKFGNGHKTATV